MFHEDSGGDSGVKYQYIGKKRKNIGSGKKNKKCQNIDKKNEKYPISEKSVRKIEKIGMMEETRGKY